MANKKEYEMAIKIAGRVEASLKGATGLTTKELQKITREAVKANTTMRAQFDSSFANMDKGFSKIENVAKKTFHAVATAAKIGAVATGAIVAVSTKVGSEFEAQMKTVQAISGASSQDLAKLTEKAKEMGVTTVFSATEAGKAMEYMAMAGWKTQDMVDGLGGIMNLAAASGEDLATVSDIITDDLTAFGLGADQAGRFADVLAAASSNSNTNVAMMGETFKYAGSIAGSLGYSIEDTALAVGLMANNGIKASQAGTQMRKMMSSLAAGAEITGKKFGRMNIEAANADGSMRSFTDLMTDLREGFSQMSEQEQVLNAKNLVGERAMTGLLAIVNSSSADWNKLSSAINNAEGAAQRMADTRLDNLKGDATLAKSALEGAGIQIYEDLNPLMRAATQGFTQGVQDFTKWLDNSDAVKDIADSIIENIPTAKRVLLDTAGAVIEFAEPLLSLGGWCLQHPQAIASVLISIGGAMQAYKLVSTMHKFANGVISVVSAFSNPVTGWVTIGTLAVGAIAGITYAYKTWQKEVGKRDLAEHFGNVSLSLQELDEVARFIVDNGTLENLDTAMSAFDDAKGHLRDFSSATKTLNKLNWKVAMNMQLSEKDNQSYLDAANTLIASAQDALTNERYSMSLGLDIFTNDDAQGKAIRQQFDAFYTSNEQELAALGTKLQETINESFNDGLLTIEEAEKLAELQKQIGSIQSQLAAADFSASLEIAKGSVLGNLNSDTFLNLIDEVGKATADADAKTKESYHALLKSAAIQLDNKDITHAQYDAMIKEFENNYLNQVSQITAQGHQTLVDTINQNYAAEMSKYVPDLSSSLMENMQQYMSGDMALHNWTDDFANMRDALMAGVLGDLSIDNETRQAMKQLWKQLEPQQDEMTALAKTYSDAGKEIPAALAKSLHDAATVGAIAGDQDALWYLIGEKSKESSEYTALLESLYQQGYALPDEILAGIEGNQSILSARDKVAASLSRVFANPIKVNAALDITTNTPGLNVLSNKARRDMSNNAIKSLNLPGYATGGIIHRPTLATFAEDGPEAAIPLDGSARSISLWRQAGEMLGVLGGKSTAESNLSKLEESDAGGGVSIHFAPVQNFNAGTPSKEDILEANRMSFSEFEVLMKQYLKKDRRLSFSG